MEEKNTNEELMQSTAEKDINKETEAVAIETSTEEAEKVVEENMEKQAESKESIEQHDNQQTKETNLISKTLGILGKILCWSMIIILAAILIRALIFKKYDVFGYRFYLIMSGSMEPTIGVSDAVITKEITEAKEGDIIAFNYNGETTVHRVVKVYNENEKKLYQTKGDNNNAIDKGLVQIENVKGKVICKIPNIGNIILFLQRNIIIILILIIGVSVIVALIRRLI